MGEATALPANGVGPRTGPLGRIDDLPTDGPNPSETDDYARLSGTER
jgi:hypothetical protein